MSGGADSLALLALAVDAGLRVTAVHVDHALRPGSADEADVVRDVAAGLGAAFRAERVEIAPGPNLEARARAARKQVLAPDAMTGHTADDQAETVLLNLARGAGLDGLGAMRAGPTKPILALRRAETRALCDERGFAVVHDPSNDDPRHRRNRIRHEVLPLLADVADRDVGALVARAASLLADDAALLERFSMELDPTDAGALAAAPVPLARRAVRRWLTEAGPPYPPDAAAVERVLAVAAGVRAATEVCGGLRVRRSAGRLLLSRA
ncbi:MAG: tRNA(Ile)-lysidine synthase [Actinomycetota bacterium]|nr:tRNA(Ile)-lysidine synthase [Actinomycetota bacterium]